MAEECRPCDVPTIKEDTPLEGGTSEPQSFKADDSLSNKDTLTLPASGAASTAATTPVSDSECSMNPEDPRVKSGALSLPMSGATSAAASTPVSESEGAMSPEDLNVKAAALSVSGATSATASISDSGCAMSPGDAHAKGALKLPVSGATSAGVSDSEGAMSPEDLHAKAAGVDPSITREPSAVSAVCESKASSPPEILSAEQVAEMMSPGNEAKVGIFKGVKTAIKTKVKSVWKKLSPKKSEKAALAVSNPEAKEASSPEEEKKPYKVVTYVSATRGSLVLNSTASEEVTLDTDLPTSTSEVFTPDAESMDTETHASRLPSLGASCSEESPEHNAQESSGDRGDEARDDENDPKSS